MALKSLKIQDYCQLQSENFISLESGLKFVTNLKMKICPKSFRPKRSFEKFVPARQVVDGVAVGFLQPLEDGLVEELAVQGSVVRPGPGGQQGHPLG
jgi:hypothetical protein